MKYIRTEKGIIAFGKEHAYPTRVVKGNQHYIFTELTETTFEKMKDFNKWNIIAQADTIEELCDGVIEKCLSGNRFCPIETFNKQEAIKCMNIDVNRGFKEFYYGIFVEHNNKIDFISVAKMNEKGELELI